MDVQYTTIKVYYMAVLLRHIMSLLHPFVWLVWPRKSKKVQVYQNRLEDFRRQEQLVCQFSAQEVKASRCRCQKHTEMMHISQKCLRMGHGRLGAVH